MKYLNIIFIYLILFSFSVMGQGKKLVWDYPVKPGTEKWKSFNTHEEMLNACQIPENILQNMNTADLMEICLDYPLKGDIYAYSNVKNGIEHVSLQFNGFAELFSRNDNFQNLLLKLEQSKLNLNNDLASNKNMAEQGEIMLNFAIIESFLSFDAVLLNSDYNQKKQLSEITKEVLNYKLQNSDKFGIFSVTSTAFLLGKTLQKINKFSNITPSTAKFLNNNITVNDSIITEIVQTFNNAKL
ncbi:MAG: hypothetical protein FWF54_04890 [Candidatus Azobacteroides sp.]|nr:hypothetical protein [Candidatus Azobacteroides sp.]